LRSDGQRMSPRDGDDVVGLSFPKNVQRSPLNVQRSKQLVEGDRPLRRRKPRAVRDACATQSVTCARPWRRTWARPRCQMGSRSRGWSG
jgi:hypothetical protein